jgi:hypothetical protein
LALEKEPQVVEALREAAQNVRGEGAVGDGFAKLDEGVGEGLHAPAVLGDGGNTLAQRAELGVDELDAGLAVADELLLEGDPRDSSGRRRRGDDLEQLRRDGAVEPCENMEVHANPMRNVGEDGVAQHVVGEGVLAKDEEEEVPPLGERWDVQVEDDRNECTDVENAQSLGVEV